MAGDHIVTPQNFEQYQALQKRIKQLQADFQECWQQQTAGKLEPKSIP